MTRLLKTGTGFTPGRIQNWIRLVAVLAALVSPPLHSATFTTSLDHDTLILGDATTLSLRFEGSEPKSLAGLPTVPGLQFLNAGNPSVNRMDINGQRTLVVGVAAKPTQAGEFTIPAISAELDGKTVSSQPLKLKVVSPQSPAPGSEADQQKLALLRIVPPKRDVFVGESVVLELQLLLNKSVQNNGNPEVPSLQFDGCIVGKPIGGNARWTVIGLTYFKLTQIYLPLTVLKTGPIKLGPLDGNIVVELPGQRQRDFFDPLGMFNRGIQQRVALSAPEQTLTVLPLPETGKPASFTGAVGSYRLALFSASPTNVAMGDPITIRVQINGRGALDAFTLPDQPAWKEFKTYPPTVKTETTGDLGLEGTKSFEQIVVPQNTEIKELPQFDFTYFNPETRRYETLHQAALPIIVRPSGSTPTPTIAANGATTDSQKPAQDIVHIRPRLGSVHGNSTVWVKQAWFIALQGLPVLALIGAVAWRKRSDALANNPRLRRQKQVAQIVSDGLAELQQLATAGKADMFFATVFRLMQEQIGERLNVPASAITEAVVDEKLRARGLDESGADLLHELFQSCNRARYAPEQSAQKLEAVIPKLKMALSAVQEVQG